MNTWSASLVRASVAIFAAGLVGCGAAGYAENRPDGYADGYNPEAPPYPEQGYQPAGASDTYEDTDPSAVSDFYGVLAPYGTWVNDPNYGTVWVPDAATVGADFAPYQSAGSWAYTDDGDYLWNSDYDWGYIPFHYGRWVYITSRGWSWVPGRRYAPSWVAWRTSDFGYVGWAPMPPSWYWLDGYAYSLWASPTPAWVFCQSNQLFYPSISRQVIRDRPTIERIAAHSHVHQPRTPASPHVGAPAGSETKSWERTRPSLQELGVPQSAVPAERGRPNPNALALSTKSGSAEWRGARADGSPPNRQENNPAYAERGTPQKGGWEIGPRPEPVANPRPVTRLPDAGRNEPVHVEPRPVPRPEPGRAAGAAPGRQPAPLPPVARVPGAPPAGAARPPAPSRGPAPSFRPPTVHAPSPGRAPSGGQPSGGRSGGGSRGGGGGGGSRGGGRR